MFLGEVLAIAALRAIFILRRDKIMPRGSKVHSVNGRPVYRPEGKSKFEPSEKFQQKDSKIGQPYVFKPTPIDKKPRAE